MGVDAVAAKPIQTSQATPTSQAPKPQAQAPAAKAATIAGDNLWLSSGTTFDLPGVKAGDNFKVNGSFKGHGFGGKATVNSFDGKTLDATVNASAMLFIHVNVHIRFEAQPDGSVMFVGERVNGGNDDSNKVAPNMPQKVGTKLHVISKKPGETVMQASDGNKVTVNSNAKGGLTIAYDKYQIAMNK